MVAMLPGARDLAVIAAAPADTGRPGILTAMQVPPGWRAVEHHGVGPFTTSMVLERPDGARVVYTAWRNRKGHGLLAAEGGVRLGHIPWWAPTREGWWIAVLFMIGSACFALGSVPAIAEALGAFGPWIFFVGSAFFTSAAYLQYHQASNESDDLETGERGRRWAALRTHSLGWWAASSQFAGTLWFNLTTFAGTRAGLGIPGEEALVWAPDAIGSILFLVASTFAVLETRDGHVQGARPTLESGIAAINMVGSIAFGISAVAAYIDPANGELLDAAVANSMTFVGAVCFLVGAALLLPDMSRAPGPASAAA